VTAVYVPKPPPLPPCILWRFFLSTLCEELSHSYSKVVQSEYYHLDKNENEFFSAIIKALENNIPVELGFIRKTTGGHAVAHCHVE